MIKLWDAEVPKEQDWVSEYSDDLDYQYAFTRLFGKNRDESIELIKLNALSYIEDLGLMPPKVFQFYFKVLIEYLLSNESKGESDAASSIFRLIKYDIESNLNKAKSIKAFLPLILRSVAERQEFYDADIDIYGDFKEKALRIERLLK